jgi:hypothetical protein
MTVKFYLFFVFLGLSAAVHAQTASPSATLPKSEKHFGNQTVYLGFLGNGLFISANYDIRFGSDELGWGVHAGIGYTPGYDKLEHYRDSLVMKYTKEGKYADKLTIPVGVSYVLGKKNRPHRVEFGLGITYMNGDSELFDQETTRFTWLLVSKAGYRRYYFNSHFMWKVSLNPLISLNGAGSVPLPWLEGGIGLQF